MSSRVSLIGILAGGVVIALVVFFASYTIQAEPQTSRILKIGVVDVSKVLDSYGRREDSKKELESFGLEREKDIKEKEEEIKTKMEKVELLLEGSPERKKEEKNLDSLKREYKLMVESARDDFREKYAESLIALYKDIVDECETYAKAEEYDLILRKEELDLDKLKPEDIANISAQKVIYNAQDLDITPAIIDRLKKKYESGVGK